MRAGIVGLKEHNSNHLRSPKKVFYGCYKSVFSQLLYFREKWAGSSQNFFIYLTCFFSLVQHLIRRSFFWNASWAFPYRFRNPAFHFALQSETLPAALSRPSREVHACNCPALICKKLFFLIIVDGKSIIFDMDISYIHNAVSSSLFTLCRKI